MSVSRSLLAAALAALLAACSPPKPASGPTRPLSEWTGEEAQLLDDGIDIGAIPLGDASPGRDETSEGLIPRRMDSSDAVVLGKVIAVSSEPNGENKKRFRLEIASIELLSGKPLEGNVVLKVEPNAPSYGTIRAVDTHLIGRKLVVFVRQYAADDGGEPVTHYHLSPATKPVLDGISVHSTKKQFQ